jgi:hypothetical protein
MMVTFRSTAFNTSEPDKNFVSLRPYGSDLANWLIHDLALHHAAAELVIWQQDAGWLVRFRLRRASYDFTVRFRDPDWVGLLERRRGILDLLLHREPKNVEFDALALVDSMLSSSGLISDMRWLYDDGDDDDVDATYG